jgi:hypothetical protein
MGASDDNAAPPDPGGWWANPPRPGMQRLINPVAYRHLRPLGVLHIAGGSVAAGAGLICVAYRVYGWAAFFLAIGAANLGGGYWYLSIDRSRPGERD